LCGTALAVCRTWTAGAPTCTHATLSCSTIEAGERLLTTDSVCVCARAHARARVSVVFEWGSQWTRIAATLRTDIDRTRDARSERVGPTSALDRLTEYCAVLARL
jgi:hypothetical protein